MSGHLGSNLRMRQLARALRGLRVRAGLTQEEAGEKLHFSGKKMSRIETGQVPSYHELQAMLDLYGLTVSEWDHYLEMRERAKQKGWWLAYGRDNKGYLALEHDACLVREFQIGFLPGLLQTAEYLRMIMVQAVPRLSSSAIAAEVAVRRKRQERLLDGTLALHAIIDESVFGRRLSDEVGPPQLRHILATAALSNVTVQLLPLSAGQHVGLNGTFTVLRFPDADETDVGYVEHITGSVQMEDAAQVSTCNLTFDHLSGLALSPEDSITWISRLGP